jgi:hypothetical protein
MEVPWLSQPAVMGIHDRRPAAAEMELFWGNRQTVRAIIGALLLCYPAGTHCHKFELGAKIYNILIGLLSAREYLPSTNEMP